MASWLSGLVSALIDRSGYLGTLFARAMSAWTNVEDQRSCCRNFGFLAAPSLLAFGLALAAFTGRLPTSWIGWAGALAASSVAIIVAHKGWVRLATTLNVAAVPWAFLVLGSAHGTLQPLETTILLAAWLVTACTAPPLASPATAWLAFLFMGGLATGLVLAFLHALFSTWLLIASSGLVALVAGHVNSSQLRHALNLAHRAEELECALAELKESHGELEELHRDSDSRSKQLAALNDELLHMQFRLEESYKQMERMNQQLQSLATTDGMTGIPNHRQFQEMLRKQVDQSFRYHHPLSLLLLDVDNFKQYNDAFGHPAGDIVLRQLAQVLVSVTRSADIPARYGGEEFAIILPNTCIAHATEMAERIRATVENTNFPGRRITVSIGVSTYPEHGTVPTDLIAAADRALYTAKSSGRNSVAVASVTVHLVQGRPLEDALEVRCAADSALPIEPGREGTRCAESWDRFEADCLQEFGGIEGLLQQPCGSILQALLAAIDARDQESSGHFHRVTRYSLRLALEVTSIRTKLLEATSQEYLLTPGDYRDLAIGAMLHDIGKLHIPERVLAKRTPLTEADWRMLWSHPIVGAELVTRFVDLAPAAHVIRNHHERWDGKGYPDGKREFEIPLVARIFSICDSYDAMTSDLPFRRRIPPEQAVAEIRREAGSQFDPFLSEVFASIPIEEWKRLSGLHSADSAQIAA